MGIERIAILLTCYNRKEKTIKCLESLNIAIASKGLILDVFLVDDGSTDGTSAEVGKLFPTVNVIPGSGQLFWSGGMRFAWKSALEYNKEYDAYILLNDDVVLTEDFLGQLIQTHNFCLKQYNQSGIYVCSTKDKLTLEMSYGGTLITNRGIKITTQTIDPADVPVPCTMANANILMVTKDVVDKIGIIDENYIHQFGDYDYTLTASKNGIPVLVCPGFGGYCSDDHGNSWLKSGSTLKKRINYLYSPLGLSYKEQTYYLKKNFKYQYPYYFSMLWLKTLFPFIWDNFKKSSKQ